MKTMLFKAGSSHRILAIMLTLILLTGLLPQTVFAGESADAPQTAADSSFAGLTGESTIPETADDFSASQVAEELPIDALEVGDPITVYIDFEGYNLGHGFYIDPTKLTLPAGATSADATFALLEQTNHEYRHDGGDDTFYLRQVKGFGVGSQVNPPDYVTGALDGETLYSRSDADWLGEMDYYVSSGWMITVNHEMIGTGAGARVLMDGDVIRWQFSVLGLGADLGVAPSFSEAAEPLYTHADKTALYRALFTEGAGQEAIDAALAVIINPTATNEEVAAALEEILDPETTPEPEIVPEWLKTELSGVQTWLLDSTPAPSFGISKGEWLMLGLARGGYEKDNHSFP
ncbi:hypothetical protein AGMMS49983_20390 [Clostridia bacterium]|nr:hypothetical protein AGMMS49983_20390 [Clostridia bacterium]